MDISNLIPTTGACSCGKIHTHSIDKVICRRGAINFVADIAREYSAGRVFVLCDPNTYAAAGIQVCEILSTVSTVRLHILSSPAPAPNEYTVGEAVMHFDYTAEMIFAVGSGVVNDTGKILAAMSHLPYCIVATAPSMDGYASATSSMERDGLKVSLPTAAANVIIGDTDILKNAPAEMLISGLGDMLAKYVSICEWRIANLVTGEYYCESVAELVRAALAKCVASAPGLLSRDAAAVEAVFEGLVTTGLAMSLAGLSRPASGVEHYFSHVWDMRALEFGTPSSTHGIQCALGTLLSVKMYEELKKLVPNPRLARERAKSFDKAAHFEMLRTLLGRGAEAMIELDSHEKKYALPGFEKRLETITSNWDKILEIISAELPKSQELETLMHTVGLPTDPSRLGLDADIKSVFSATKDIRDKYVLSRLVFDLGLEESIYPPI